MKKIILFTLIYIPICFSIPEETQTEGAYQSQTMRRINSAHSGDTGHDSRTPTSSQSSVRVEVGTPAEDFIAETPTLFAESQIDDEVAVEPEAEINTAAPLQAENIDAPQPTLVDAIDHAYHHTPPLWFWALSETEALGDLKNLAQKKRAFKNHIKAWAQKYFRRWLDAESSALLVNRFSEIIDDSKNDYWERKRTLLGQLSTMAIPRQAIDKFNQKVLRPHEIRCRDQVKKCAQKMRVFSGIPGISPIQGRYKLLPDSMVRTALKNITSIVNGYA